MRPSLLIACAIGFSVAPLAAQTPVVRMEDFSPQELRQTTFVLAGSQSLSIQAVGAEPREDRKHGFFGKNRNDDNDDYLNSDNYDVWPAAAWIIDARTRRVVWDLRTAETTRRTPGLRTFDGTVSLPAGTYVAYFASYAATSTWTNDNVRTIANFFRRGSQPVIHYGGPYVDDGSYHEFRFAIRGDGREASAREAEDAERAFTADAVATIRPDSGGSSARVAFEVSRATDVDVYAIGELRRHDQFDYGWIISADTHTRIWTMDWSNTRAAGGTRKNRFAQETLHLAPGRYVAYYVTDDSHDPFAWNGVPPFDPANYGLTLRVADASARAAIHTISWEPVPAGQQIVQMIGVGDNETRSEGFTLTRPMDVHVYAIGEGINPEGDLDDRGWIVDATTRRRVWSMRYEDTQPAGGATKNRLFDGVVHLEAGNYVVHYVTDDSHSFNHWNDAPPAEARYYGISLYPEHAADRSAVQPFDEHRNNADVIAELTRMRDDVRARRTFDLDRDQTVRIVAEGEGTDGEMDDWGWIEDAGSGRTVWEMSYHMTEHAGGAEKNRLFDGTIRLPAGHYILHWQSDGSHSYASWNADPPDDPEGWGITVMKTVDGGR